MSKRWHRLVQDIPTVGHKEPQPSSKKLFRALLGKTHLKYLRLPAEMYDVSRRFMLTLSKIKSLEHLEFGFDYRDSVCGDNMLVQKLLT